VSDDGYHGDRDYIDYRSDLPPHHADPTPLPDRDKDARWNKRPHGYKDREDELPKRLVGAKTVSSSIVFLALATSVMNPALLIYTLPPTTLVAKMLSLAGRVRRREPQRLRPCLEM